jgi:hypothetical protein
MSVDDTAPGFELRQFSRFLVVMLLLDFVVLGVYAAVGPPDPVTQLLVVGPGLLLAPAVAFWLVYRDGWTRLAARLTGG